MTDQENPFEGFDPYDAEHMVELTGFLDRLLNHLPHRYHQRFALVVWLDKADEIKGVLSNEVDKERVMEMLDDAGLKIEITEAQIFKMRAEHDA